MLTEQGKNMIQTAAAGYAWPGGYPTFLLMTDGKVLCPECVRAELRQIIGACVANAANGGWMPAAADVNWEDPELYCGNCGNRIKSAYAEDDAA